MITLSIPCKEGNTKDFFNFPVDSGSVFFAGSRHTELSSQLCYDLVEYFGRLGFGFSVGCSRGVDRSFRDTFITSRFIRRAFVACAFKDRVDKAGDITSSLVVPATSHAAAALAQRTIWLARHCSLSVIFPDDPKRHTWGKGSSLAIRTCIKYGKAVFVVTDIPPVESDDYRLFHTSLFGIVSGYWMIPVSKEVVV
jgi:hypothetical protein